MSHKDKQVNRSGEPNTSRGDPLGRGVDRRREHSKKVDHMRTQYELKHIPINSLTSAGRKSTCEPFLDPVPLRQAIQHHMPLAAGEEASCLFSVGG